MAYPQVGETENARASLKLAVNAPATFAGKEDARKALAALK